MDGCGAKPPTSAASSGETTVNEKTSRRRVSRRAAIATVALMSVAAPAAASVIIENFIKADITSSAACFTKVGGADHTAYNNGGVAPAAPALYVNFDTAPTLSAAGVNLINETVSLRGYAGDRTRFTDVIRYRNTCGFPLSVKLISEADPAAGAAVSGVWDGGVSVFLSKVSDAINPAAPTSSVDLAGDSVNWNKQFAIDNTGAVTSTGAVSVTLASGQELQGAFLVDLAASGAAATRTLRFTAQATA
jgi:hypothetical protein